MFPNQKIFKRVAETTALFFLGINNSGRNVTLFRSFMIVG